MINILVQSALMNTLTYGKRDWKCWKIENIPGGNATIANSNMHLRCEWTDNDANMQKDDISEKVIGYKDWKK